MTIKNNPTTISGRKDFDVVSFADYARDLKEQSEQAAHIIKTLIKERDRMELCFWLAVIACGGKISIPRRDFMFRNMADIDWQIEEYPYDDTQRFSAKIRKKVA